jgi:hypothetical protein
MGEADLVEWFWRTAQAMMHAKMLLERRGKTLQDVAKTLAGGLNRGVSVLTTKNADEPPVFLALRVSFHRDPRRGGGRRDGGSRRTGRKDGTVPAVDNTGTIDQLCIFFGMTKC